MNQTSERKPLRALFYGQTHEHAPGKFETLKKLRDEYEIVAVVDDSPRKSPMYRDRAYPMPDWGRYPIIGEDEVDPFLERTPVDVVFVEVTNCNLMEIADRFAERGVPMHCDKPCGEAMEPYRRVVEKCRAKNLPFQIGYMYRGNPALKWIWDFVAKGGLGEIGFIEADMNHDYGDELYPGYISTFRGGIFYNLGCHLVDVILPLVRGELSDSRLELRSAIGDPEGAKTSGTGFLRFGATEVVLRTASHMPGGILSRRLRIDGTLGTLDLCPIERFDGGELKFTLSLKGEPPRETSFGVQTDRYAPQLLDLAAIVRGEKKNDQDYDRDLAVHALTLKTVGIEA